MISTILFKRSLVVACGIFVASWAVFEREFHRTAGETDHAYLELLGTQGVIYFRPAWVDPDDGLYCMNADGTGKTRLREGVVGEPSWRIHAGHRWFLATREVAGEPFPGGSPRRELFAVRDDGTSVQITSRPDLDVAPISARWHSDDIAIAWVARRWSPDGEVMDGGIYTCDVLFDDERIPRRVAEVPAEPRLRLPLVAAPHVSDWMESPAPDLASFDWSPDGQSVVYESASNVVRIVDMQTGTVSLLMPGCVDPVWSHDGSRIAAKECVALGRIVTVRADGSSVSTAVGAEGVVAAPVWSPTGEYLAYQRVDTELEPLEAPVNSDVYVVRPGDVKQVNLTEDTILSARPVAWRGR